MKIQETKQITSKETIAVKCDVCGVEKKSNYTPYDWHTIVSGHRGYPESYDYDESHDVCSPDCYMVKFKQGVDGLKDEHDAHVDGFEIQFARRLVEWLKQ